MKDTVTTRQFVKQARRYGTAIRGALQDVVRRTPSSDDPRAERVGRDHVLGLTVGTERVALWFLEKDDGQSADTPPLADLRRAELLDAGVPDKLITQVQAVRSLKALEALSIPAETAARLRFMFVQIARGLGLDPEDLQRRAVSEEQLNDLLHGRITDLLLNLDPPQRRIVELGGHGPIVVKGVAGSGKTAVAIHRVFHMLRQRSILAAPRILYLAFNRSLASAATELLGTIGVRPGEVEVWNFHRWCFHFLNLKPGLLEDREQAEFLRRAREAVKKSDGGSPVFDYPDEFWNEELHRVRGRVVAGEDEYLSMERYGAGRGLRPELRRLVWRVVDEYERSCQQRRRLDFDGMVRAAWTRLERLGEAAPKYDHVIVDEGQDLTPLAHRIVARLARTTGDLLVTFDPAQSIYERGFRWKACGIEVQGARSFALTKNYRNTKEILELARPFLGTMRLEKDVSGDAEETLEPDRPSRHGVEPRDLVVPAAELYSMLTVDVRRRIESEHVPPQNIAVLAARTRTLRAAHAALQAAGVLCQRHGKTSEMRLGDRSVKVCTMHSAKGLEWSIVYLLIPAEDLEPRNDTRDQEVLSVHTAKTRRLVYMAMTRAMVDLVILRTNPRSAPASREPAPSRRADAVATTDDEPRVAQGKTKFHRPDCKHLSGGYPLRRFPSRRAAFDEGLRPCRTCRA